MTRRQAAAGHHAVKMRMVLQVLAPGVEHGEKTNLRSYAPGIRRDFEESLGSCPKQDSINDALVLQSQRRQQMGQREDYVEIRNGQQLCGAVGEPLLAC